MEFGFIVRRGQFAPTRAVAHRPALLVISSAAEKPASTEAQKRIPHIHSEWRCAVGGTLLVSNPDQGEFGLSLWTLTTKPYFSGSHRVVAARSRLPVAAD